MTSNRREPVPTLEADAAPSGFFVALYSFALLESSVNFRKALFDDNIDASNVMDRGSYNGAANDTDYGANIDIVDISVSGLPTSAQARPRHRHPHCR
jgi:hypothetical protein